MKVLQARRFVSSQWCSLWSEVWGLLLGAPGVLSSKASGLMAAAAAALTAPMSSADTTLQPTVDAQALRSVATALCLAGGVWATLSPLSAAREGALAIPVLPAPTSTPCWASL